MSFLCLISSFQSSPTPTTINYQLGMVFDSSQAQFGQETASNREFHLSKEEQHIDSCIFLTSGQTSTKH
jgi:hypothetical protein